VASLSPIKRLLVGISGPTAGLAVIVLSAVEKLGFNGFLLALVVAGVFQIIMGSPRLALLPIISRLPSLTACYRVWVYYFLKQIPHAIGYDRDYEGDTSFFSLTATRLFLNW